MRADGCAITPWGPPSATELCLPRPWHIQDGQEASREPGHPLMGLSNSPAIADTQQPVTAGPRPRSLNGSWAAALVSSPETTSHPTAGVPAWPHPPSSASSTTTTRILPTVIFLWSASLHQGQRGKPTSFALGRGTWGFCWHPQPGGCWHCRDHPQGSFGCKHTCPRHRHGDTHASPHVGPRTSVESLLLLPDLGQDRDGHHPRQAEVPYMGVRAFFPIFCEWYFHLDTASSSES